MKDTLTQFPASTAWLLHVSTDVVVFGIRQANLCVLLRQRYSETLGKTDWALPGGYIRPVEPLKECVLRTLAHQTAVRDVYVEQLYTFGRPDRHPKSRVITVSYLALMPAHRDDDIAGVPNIGWHEVANLPALYLDHADIIECARRRLQAKLQYSTAALELMPEQFTLTELQRAYEAVLCEPLDKRNFRKKMLSLGCIEETGQLQRDEPHRPARLYRSARRGELQYLK